MAVPHFCPPTYPLNLILFYNFVLGPLLLPITHGCGPGMWETSKRNDSPPVGK